MHEFLSLLISIIYAGTILAGLLAFLRGPKRSQNRWFFDFTFFLSVWIVANFIDSNFVDSWTDLFLKIDFSSILFTGWALLQFALVFLTKESNKARQKISRNLTITGLLINTVFALLIFTNHLVTCNISTGKLVVTYLTLFWPYIFILLAYFVLAFAILFRKGREVRGLDKSALKLIYVGLFIALISNIFTNLLFPEFFKARSTIEELNIIGYVGLFIMAIMIYIAITTQKLFDIRIVIARSVGYVLSFGAIVLIYVTPTILIFTHLLNYKLSLGKILYLVAVTCVVAVLFQPLRSFFNRLSNKIFYHNYYEIQDVIDKLGNLLVGSVDPKDIQNKTIGLLMDVIKPSSAKFLLLADADKDDQHVITVLSALSRQFIDADELSIEGKGPAYKSLAHNEIALAVRLRTGHNNLGFLTLGYQKSGSSYSDNDKQLLKIAADEIAISLQNALRFKEIQQFNVTLQAKVNEATKELKNTNEKLKSLDNTKDDFISMASHQLRTPLVVIKGYLTMIANGDVGKVNDKQKDFITRSLASSQTMVNLVAELLNVSRITSGKFSVELTPANLADLVEEVVNQLVNMASAKKIALTFTKPKDFPLLMLDKDKTQQVIGNFIDNAIHYSRGEDAKIDVQLTTDTKDITFKVVDNGIGVPEREKSHLFTKFFRANNAKDARPDGTGVGLYVAKVIITQQGGDLIFESKEEEGSTFGFRFKRNKIVDNNKSQQ